MAAGPPSPLSYQTAYMLSCLLVVTMLMVGAVIVHTSHVFMSSVSTACISAQPSQPYPRLLGFNPESGPGGGAEEEAQRQARRARYWRAEAGRLSCELTEFGPTGGFCALNDEPVGFNDIINTKFADYMADFLFPPESTVINLGAGFGQYGAYYRQKHKSFRFLEFDGTENISKVTKDKVTFFDLSEPEPLPIEGEPLDQRHWRISIEVAEHIPQRLEPFFTLHLLNNAEPTPAGVVLTWAEPEQPGHGHINNQGEAYVRCLMEKVMGFEYDAKRTRKLRQAGGGKQSNTYWLENTAYVFVRPQRYEDSNWLKEGRRRTATMTSGDVEAIADFQNAYKEALGVKGCKPIEHDDDLSSSTTTLHAQTITE